MQTNFHCPVIHCNHCAMTIKLELGDLAGVNNVDVNIDEKTVLVSCTEAVDEAAIRALLDEIGFPAE